MRVMNGLHLTKKEFKEEHETLVRRLKNPTKKGLRSEAKKQVHEMAEALKRK